jgi:glutamate synthase domain-containing protein 3
VVAVRLLEDWSAALEQFRQVMPVDYRRVLREHKGKRAAAA